MGNVKNTGRAVSLPAGLAFGAVVSMIATVLIAFVGAQMIMKEVLLQEQIGYCSMAALLTGTISGAIAASRKVKHRKIIVCMLSGCVYLCLLLASTALLFGGQYDGFGVTAITIFIGSIASALVTLKAGEKGIKHNRKIRS